MTTTRTTSSAVALLATLALLAVGGCGGGDDNPTADPSAATSSPSSPSSATPEPTATAPGDVRTTTTSSALPVPQGGPTEVARFPVPPGVQVKGPGPRDRSWQFDITTDDTDGVLAFYRKALADRGYSVRSDVDVTIGIEQVHYDIQFGGPAKGYIVADKPANDVFVLVESLPAS